MVGDWSKYTSVYDITNRILKRVRGGELSIFTMEEDQTVLHLEL